MRRSQTTLAGAGVTLLGVSGCVVSADPAEGLQIGLTIGVGVMILGNVLYAKMRLEDEPSAMRRFVSFMVGLPTTFLIFLLVEPSDSWIHRRLSRESDTDPDGDPVEIRREFEQELKRIRRADLTEGPDRLRTSVPEPSSDA